jgi:phage gp45-like
MNVKLRVFDQGRQNPYVASDQKKKRIIWISMLEEKMINDVESFQHYGFP